MVIKTLRKFKNWIIFGVIAGVALPASANDLSKLNLPAGFKIEKWADVPGARTIRLSPDNQSVFVGTRSSRIYKIDLQKKNYTAGPVEVFANDLNVANGIDLDKDGNLVIAEQHRVIRILKNGKRQILVKAGLLPDRRHHGWRYAGFGPDGTYYVAVGAPCNICEVKGVEGTILRFDPVNWRPSIYAKGVRNSVGFDWHPDSGKMYFTDNGGDNLGDDIPPDELNRVDKAGDHYGYPFLYGNNIPYPQFANAVKPSNPIVPQVNFAAHVASLGIDFYEGNGFPKKYQKSAFVAQRGSWNRTDPIGYRIVNVQFDDKGNAVSNTVFIDGWLRPDGEVLGRPVDLEELPDGSLLISDDYSDVIYRVTYQQP
ncbi:sorbosone dehydrogenase family protein [Sneathiella sp. P13V-1]|uniref:PQQ-dependent sugar dehydrogenase n=1 Tax=Sneathiella sp. P13V-1 TaxID=2697366 RepID=UPI00187B9A3A|nr:PQQ-dependent sugar dehydrogenase [Sneathiella sp. P13V-1]MBE7637544.1 sorbosone dehydrogenase family protein [Sneathiella sp. P13V-1]